MNWANLKGAAQGDSIVLIEINLIRKSQFFDLIRILWKLILCIQIFVTEGEGGPNLFWASQLCVSIPYLGGWGVIGVLDNVQYFVISLWPPLENWFMTQS